MVLYDNPFTYTKNPNRLISKAIDNRYGCGLALETIAKFDQIDLPFTLVVGATVQEEVGLRGAETAVNHFGPDVFLALDASPVNDAVDPTALGALNQGFLIRMYDPNNIMHQGLLNFFVELAKKHKIPYQHFMSMGGTDAAKALDLARKMLFTVLQTLNKENIQKLKETNS